MATAIWWLRRDLRLTDNRALAAALDQADTVIPVFILDPVLWTSPYAGEKRIAFMLGGLRSLDGNLRGRGSRLILRQGDPVAALGRLIAETGAVATFAEADYSPYARRRDARAAAALPLSLVDGLTVHPPDDLLKDDGTPYTVFTPFSRRWKATPYDESSFAAPEQINTPGTLNSESLPDLPALPEGVPFPPGEAEAQRRLQAFGAGNSAAIYAYGERRDLVGEGGTSQLSPYLRWGMISARQAVNTAYRAIEAASSKEERRSAEVWLNELIWREFYVAILYHFPKVRAGAFRAEYNAIPWQNDARHFAAWCAGETGYPIVDAAMRQLVHCGWMHNRARMIAASFLVKDLLIDWRQGERWFMQHLVDGDPAANNGGWQWTAGAGTDAAPYFRIFNPALQSKKFDPDGLYICRWLPELQAVPGKFLHEPWTMPADMQRSVGCIIGQDYPAPIINHQAARERTLAAYAAAKAQAAQR